jgi:hypothetical protein
MRPAVAVAAHFVVDTDSNDAAVALLECLARRLAMTTSSRTGSYTTARLGGLSAQ